MAYSRWGQSKWFVFGCSPHTVPKTEQKLSIQHCDGPIHVFTYQELTQDMSGCLKKVMKAVSSTSEEIEELRGYIRAFLHEVETGERI